MPRAIISLKNKLQNLLHWLNEKGKRLENLRILIQNLGFGCKFWKRVLRKTNLLVRKCKNRESHNLIVSSRL